MEITTLTVSHLRNRLFNNTNDCIDHNKSEMYRNDDSHDESNKDNSKIQHGKHNSIIPPPYPLIPKSLLPVEPVRSGAPIQFMKLTYAKAGSNILLEKQSKEDRSEEIKELEQTVYTKGKRPLKSMFTQDGKANEPNPIVYSRYATSEYSANEKVPEEPWSSCIVNIKSLICEMEMVNKSLLGSLSIHKVKSNWKSSFKQYYTPVDESDKTLVFESKFESGNLNLAIKMSDNEYNLMLQNDINTNGHTQWFFFRVTNTTKDLTVKFNILNLSKPDSLYNYGMKVLWLSHQRKMHEGVDWYRDGHNILYYKNCFRREGKFGMEKSYYTLTFTITFPYDQDTVYFCYSLPYTYTDLCDDLTSVMNEQKVNTFVSRNTLWRTLAGNKCEYLTITSKETLAENHPDRIKKKGVVISARVHPGESVGSWMMKGVIDFLTSEWLEAQALRKLFVFKIIPMLNPDGVINGNYRWSLAGVDLNRRWRAPSKMIHPTVYETKKLCRNFHKEREMTLFWDLHGHSRKKNIFMYGNAIQDNPTSTRLFPYIMSKLCDYFSFKYSRFSLTKSKETTARISLYRELNIPWIYTMEASFWGANQGELADLHFNEEHLINIGRKLILALIPYWKIDPYEVVYGKKQIAEIRDPADKSDLNLDDIMKEFKDNENELIRDTDANSSAGSDSEPSEDNLSDSEIAKIMPSKNKKKKSKKIVTQISLNRRKKELEDKLKEKNK